MNDISPSVPCGREIGALIGNGVGGALDTCISELCFIMLQTQQINPQLALQVLLQFDKAINSALAHRVRNRVNFRVRISVAGGTGDLLCCKEM